MSTDRLVDVLYIRAERAEYELSMIIADLKRYAKQNETDGKRCQGCYVSTEAAQASAVAGEQRRMIPILERLKETLR